ncbi:MAG: AbrB/MazE/SpoVT family DNA-binding domain-containing protein [Coriobacteriales bacterium]
MRVELSKWGNSAGVRIPKQVLTKLGLSIGDAFKLTIGDEDGCICLMPLRSEHRRVEPAQGISFASLFRGNNAVDGGAAWPSEDMLGAEEEAWR